MGIHNKLKKVSTTAVTIWLLTACGQPAFNGGGGATMGAATYLTTFDEDFEFGDSDSSRVIEVHRDAVINARASISESSRPFRLNTGDVISVLKKQVDRDGNSVVQIYVEDSEPEGTPLTVWVSASELGTLDLQVVELEDPYDIFGEDRADTDSESSGVMTAAKKTKRKAKKGEKAMTYCYRFVKIRLQKSGLVKGYLSGGSAYQAAAQLPKHGFKRTSRGVKNARINDVCVYSGGNGGHGHIEIRTAGGWWYGYGVKPTSISLNGRRLIACFSKG